MHKRASFRTSSTGREAKDSNQHEYVRMTWPRPTRNHRRRVRSGDARNGGEPRAHGFLAQHQGARRLLDRDLRRERPRAFADDECPRAPRIDVAPGAGDPQALSAGDARSPATRSSRTILISSASRISTIAPWRRRYFTTAASSRLPRPWRITRMSAAAWPAAKRATTRASTRKASACRRCRSMRQESCAPTWWKCSCSTRACRITAKAT